MACVPWHHAGQHRDSLELDDRQCILVLAVLRPDRLALTIRRLLLQTPGSRQLMNESLEEVGGGLPSILFAYLGMCMLEIGDRDWDVAANPFHSTGVPLAPLLS